MFPNKRGRKPKVSVVEPKLEPAIEPIIESQPEAKIESAQVEERLQAPVEVVEPKVVEDKDYLRQYQQKNVANIVTLGGKATDPDPDSKAMRMKNALLRQEKVSLFIPRSEHEDPKITQTVTLNGYHLVFPKNVYLTVPKQVAEVIMESLNQQAAALLPFQINRSSRTQDALS